MLLPALLGYFTNKNTKMDRFDVVQKSQVMDVILQVIVIDCYAASKGTAQLQFDGMIAVLEVHAS